MLIMFLLGITLLGLRAVFVRVAIAVRCGLGIKLLRRVLPGIRLSESLLSILLKLLLG
jgi:hypothetical protein